MIKTGECYFVDEEGVLCLAESFMDDKGNVETKVSVVE
jgi:hypothetical protein